MKYAAVLFVGFFLSACGAKAPKLTFCVIDGKHSVLYCQRPDGTQYDVAIIDADKFIAQPLKDSESLRKYVLDLERAVAACK